MTATKNVLFIHQNFPGQFRHIAAHLAAQPGLAVVAVATEKAPGLAGVRLLRYRPHRQAARQTHRYLHSFETAVLHGQAVFRVLQVLQQEGFIPDVVVAHPGWGESLFVKEIFPRCRLVHFCEYYYHARGADAGFDPETPTNTDNAARIRIRNALHLSNLEACDAAITPTRWQQRLHPAAYRNKIEVIHEGIDTDALQPDPLAEFELPTGKRVTAGDPVVTYVARNLEPYRGFHSFMRALPAILEQHDRCEVVVVGGDEVSYGSKPDNAPNWRERMLREVAFDRSRVHFTGRIATERYRRLLQVSAAHVYLTYPFVLSWSMLEAMASGCLLIGSDTAPVREVLRHGENGVLVDFFQPQAIANAVIHALTDPAAHTPLRARARESATAFGLAQGIAGYRRVLGV